MEKQQLGGGGNYQSFCLSEDRVGKGVASRVANCHHIPLRQKEPKANVFSNHIKFESPTLAAAG